MRKALKTVTLAQGENNLEEFNGFSGKNSTLYNGLTFEEKRIISDLIKKEMEKIPGKRKKFSVLYARVKDIIKKNTTYKHHSKLYDSLTEKEKLELDELMLKEIETKAPEKREKFMKLYYDVKFRSTNFGISK